MFPRNPNDEALNAQLEEQAAEISRAKKQEVIDWRFRNFARAARELSSDDVERLAELAACKADAHTIELALRRGCTVEQAARIFL